MSLNDPQWGKRPGGGGEGPPDLEELWRRFSQKLNGMFGRRGGGGGGGGFGSGQMPGFRQVGGGAGLLIGLILIVWLASGFYIVVAGQRGVVLTFGKFSEETNAGLHWRLPYPFQSAEVVDVSGVRTVEIGYRNNVRTKVLRESQMLTDDENIVDIQFAVQYILKNPMDYLFNNRDPAEAVRQAAETTFRDIVGQSKMDYVLYEGREQIAVKSQVALQKLLDLYKTGILITKVTMQNAQPPEPVQAAFDDAVRAKQDQARQINEGKAYFNEVVPKASGEAARLLQEANGYKKKVVADAEGQTARFKQILSQYRKAPDVTRERLYLDTMQRVLESTSKIVIDTKSNANLLYLPLDKLMKMSGAEVSPENSASKPAKQSETPTHDVDMRSRDALRSRAREERP